MHSGGGLDPRLRVADGARARLVRSFALAIAAVVLCGASCELWPVEDGTCLRVKDGDSLVLRVDGEDLEVRLDGIDAPEYGDPFGKEAKRFLAKRAEGQLVSFVVYELDRYGRSVARVSLGETDLSLLMVSEGLAWHYTRYSDDRALAAAEKRARAARRNLWSQAEPVAPWVSREERRATR